MKADNVVQSVRKWMLFDVAPYFIINVVYVLFMC